MYETFFCLPKGTRFLKNKVLSGIFGPKREKVRKEWRRRVFGIFNLTQVTFRCSNEGK
jgi:hypothetical protein